MSHPTYHHNLQFDITGLKPSDSVLSAFPELLAYPVLVEHGAGAGDALLRFSIFFASKGSGLLHLEPARKKEEALRLAGIDLRDPRHAEVLAWRHRGAVLLVNQVIRLHHDLDYAVWFHTGLGLYSSAEKISALIDTGVDASTDNEEAALMAKLLAAQKGSSGGMDEDKVMRTYTLKHKLIDDVNRQRKDYKALTDELFMSDEELAKASEREKLQGAGAVGQRSRSETFVPAKQTIK